jgi:O-antigen ligase
MKNYKCDRESIRKHGFILSLVLLGIVLLPILFPEDFGWLDQYITPLVMLYFIGYIIYMLSDPKRRDHFKRYDLPMFVFLGIIMFSFDIIFPGQADTGDSSLFFLIMAIVLVFTAEYYFKYGGVMKSAGKRRRSARR